MYVSAYVGICNVYIYLQGKHQPTKDQGTVSEAGQGSRSVEATRFPNEAWSGEVEHHRNSIPSFVPVLSPAGCSAERKVGLNVT